MFTTRCLAVCLAWITCLSGLGHADTISVNFNNGQFTLLGRNDVAGAIPASNWNNFVNNGTADIEFIDGLGLVNLDPVGLMDSTGVDSGAVAVWSASESAFNTNNGAGSTRMMEGWFGVSAVNEDQITIGGLPGAFTDFGYDLYVYYDSTEVAPNAPTMNFSIDDSSIAGSELGVNYAGEFIEANEGSAGNYVVFRGLTDTEFTLSGITDDGGIVSLNGLQVTTEEFVEPDPNAPIHRYDASEDGNAADIWRDNTGGSHWTMANVDLNSVSSQNTTITNAYRLNSTEIGSGGDASPFPGGPTSFEIWFRPDELDENHQVVFETGGGQNGTSILVTDSELRLLNSSGNERGFDMSVPLDNSIDESDFIQVVAALNPDEGTVDLYVNGSAGGSEATSAEGTVGRGGNRASVLTWGSGLANLGNAEEGPGATFNLGGRTELDDMTPAGLTQFTGDVALINVYSRTLSAEEVAQAFADRLATDSLACDFNGDSLCDVVDIDAMYAAGDISTGVATSAETADFDLNGDSTIDEADVDQWLSAAATENGFAEPYAKGDADLNGTVDANDLNAVGISWQTATGQLWSTGDFTGNGGVDARDLNLVGIGWQSSISQAAAVPEPSSISLGLLAMVFFGNSIRRRRRG